MDGTLVSSLSCIYHCVNQITQKYLGEHRTVEEIISSFGPPAYVIVRNLTRKLPESKQEEAVTEYYQCYHDNVRNKALIFPGIPELLTQLKNSNFELALFTGVERKLMDYTMDGLELSQYFHVKVCSDDISKTKPDPEGIKLILDKTSSKANETIFIGDSPYDMRSGKAARVVTGAALWSPENLGDPRTERPDYEFPSVQQLSMFLFPQESKRTEEVYFGVRWQGK